MIAFFIKLALGGLEIGKLAVECLSGVVRWLFAEWYRLALVALLAVLAWQHFVSLPASYQTGWRAREAKYADDELQAAIEQRADEKAAADRRTAELTRGNALDRAAQEEITDAQRTIPDQAPTARQRSRACVELRQQAVAKGRPLPTC